MDNVTLTLAVVRWTGWGVTTWPSRNEERFLASAGDDAVELLEAVRTLQRDFYRSEAKATAPDLVSMGEQAAGEFRLLHPEIGEDAVQALKWCYTFDFR